MISQDSRLCLAVENFFDFCNWEGQSLTSQTRQFAHHVSFTSWQWLSVEDFLISGNWEGQKSRQQPIETFAKPDWQCLAVEKFFGECCNWNNQPLTTNNLPLNSLMETTKVGEFVQYIPWEGKTEIGALPKEWSKSSMSVFDVAPVFTNLSELF